MRGTVGIVAAGRGALVVRTLCGVAGLALLLGGCGLSERLDGFAWRKDEAPLERVAIGADDTPGNQSLLYTAMREAEAAEHSAVRARLSADDPAEARQEVGEVLYAVDPSRAPAWETMTTGIIPGWAGQGYGVLRAAQEMEQALHLAAESGSSADAEAARQALVCARNTIRRAEQIISLGERALARGDSIEPGLLEQIAALARELNRGGATTVDAERSSERGCGLHRAVQILKIVVPSPTAV